MSDLDKFKEIVDDVLEIIWGKEVKPKRARTIPVIKNCIKIVAAPVAI